MVLWLLEVIWRHYEVLTPPSKKGSAEKLKIYIQALKIAKLSKMDPTPLISYDFPISRHYDLSHLKISNFQIFASETPKFKLNFHKILSQELKSGRINLTMKFSNVNLNLPNWFQEQKAPKNLIYVHFYGPVLSPFSYKIRKIQEPNSPRDAGKHTLKFFS